MSGAVQKAPSFEVVYDDDDLGIRLSKGDTDQLVVIFTGQGGAAGGLTPVHFRAAGSGGKNNHLLYISDKNITWYSAPGLADRIVQSTLDVIKDLGTPRVVCIGHSMGAFGALLFCERLDAASTIAFVPQYAIDMNIVLDIRVRKGRETAYIENLEVAGDHLNGKTKPNILCGTLDEDLRHLELFEENGEIAEWIIDLPKSGVPAYLIENGLEAEVLDALVANDYEAVDRALEGRLVGHRY